jgi:hypothetical protein
LEPKHIQDIENNIYKQADAMIKDNNFKKEEHVYSINYIDIRSVQIINNIIVVDTIINSNALFPNIDSILKGTITTIMPKKLCIVQIENICVYIREFDENLKVNDKVNIKIVKKLFTKGILKLIGQIIS